MAERPLIGLGCFLTDGRAANYQRVHTNQAMDTLMEYACLSISPAFPQVGGKPDHVSSQGKEAVFATHDIYGNLVYIYNSSESAIKYLESLSQNVEQFGYFSSTVGGAIKYPSLLKCLSHKLVLPNSM